MFDIEKEVPSLELCKKLKELGYPQDTGGFYWNIWGNSKGEPFLIFIKDFENFSFVYEAPKVKKEDYFIKAPTCRELGEWLPGTVLNKYSFYYAQAKDGWIIDYANPFNPANDRLYLEGDFTEPNVRAKMLIWLVENGHVKFTNEKGGKDEEV